MRRRNSKMLMAARYKAALRFALFSALICYAAPRLGAADSEPGADPFYESFAGAPPALAKQLEPIYYRSETLMGHAALVPNPTARVRQSLAALEKKLPREPLLPLYRSKVENAMGDFKAADEAMRRYVKLSGRSGESLGIYADFLDSRLLFGPECKVIEERAGLLSKGDYKSKLKAKDGYRRIIRVIQDNNLEGWDRFEYYRKIIVLLPADSDGALEYVEALEQNGQLEKALGEARRLAPSYPHNRREWMWKEANLLDKLGRKDEEIAVYGSLEPLDKPELYHDLFGLLNIMNRMESFGDGLEASLSGDEPADARTAALWFNWKMWRGKNAVALKGINEWAAKLESRGRLKDNLGMVGEMLLQSGSAPAAAPYFYTQYAISRDSETRRKALWGVFRSLIEGDNVPGPFSGGPAPGGDLLNIYDMPSLPGGVLSLLLNDRGMEERRRDLNAASAAYYNRRAAARVADKTRAEFPASLHGGEFNPLPDMDWSLIETASLYGDWESVENFAKKFARKHPSDRRYFKALFTLAKSYGERKRFAEEGKVYGRILREASPGNDDGEPAVYKRAFNEYVASLTRRERLLDVMGLYWDEIARNPGNEELYKEFLNFTGRHNLYDKELQVYKRAIKQFDDSSWYHMMARWYLRHKGEEAFRKITDQMRARLDESQLENYFQTFIEYNWKNSGDAKSRYYLQSYLYAHERFPHNLDFVRGLLRYYGNFNRRDGLYGEELEALRLNYFVFDAGIRADLFRHWMKEGALEKSLASVSEEARRNESDIAAEFMLAWGRRWLGDHEKAVGPLDQLTRLYPGSPPLVMEDAALNRSLANGFYGEDPSKTDAAVALYDTLADKYPHNTKYPTLAGETLADSGRLKEARKKWRAILDAGRGTPAVYKELAAILWDYYQFDEAAGVLKTIRGIRKNERLFVAELAATYESKGDYNAAVKEYVKEHVALRFGAWKSLNRLAWLSGGKGLGATIDSAYREEIDRAPQNPKPLLAYSDYLLRAHRDEERVDLLAEALGKYDELDFLEDCVTAFSSAARYDLQEKGLIRILQVSGGKYEAYGRLGAFYESRKQWQKAEATYLKLLESVRGARPESRVAALNDLASFYWRREKYDDAFIRYEEAAELAAGRRRENLQHALAQRYIQKNRLDDAAAILLKLLDEHPANANYFNSLARVYTARNDVEALIKLYEVGIQNVRKSSALSSGEKKARIASLRNGQAASYTELGRHTEALDQYIEIINRDPLDRALLERVYRYASRNGLVGRLRGYYRKTAETSYKNYRWQVVLARVDIMDGDPEKAKSEYRAAIRLEPQLTWLYRELLTIHLQDADYTEAVELVKQLAELSSDPTAWHFRVSTALFRAGRRDEAVAEARETVSGAPPGYKPYFRLARFLLDWKEFPRAREALMQGMKQYGDNVYRDSLDGNAVKTMVKAVAGQRGFSEAFKLLLSTRKMLGEKLREADKFQKVKIQNSLIAIDDGLGLYMAVELNETGSAKDRRQLTQAYVDWEKSADDDGVFDAAARFARESATAELERRLYRDWLARHRNDINDKKRKNRYYSLESRFVKFLADRRDYDGLASFVESAPKPERHLMLLAHVYSVTGDREREIEVLEKYFSRASKRLGGFSGHHDPLHRLMRALADRRDERKLAGLAQTTNAYTGYVLNEFIEMGREDLALATVRWACNPKGEIWQSAKEALIYLYFNDSGPDAKKVFKQILGVGPAGESIGMRPENMLPEYAWYIYAWHYGRFLDMAHDRNYERWLVSAAEDAPRDINAYMKTGDYQLKKGRPARALVHYRLAGEIAPDSARVIMAEAEALRKKGDKKQAIAALERTLDNDNPMTRIRYAKEMARLGEAEEGNKRVAAYFVDVWPEDVDGAKKALEEFMEIWAGEPREREEFLAKLVALKPADIVLPEKVVRKKWLEGSALNFFYEKVIELIEGANPVNEPLRDKWRMEYRKHLIDTGQYDEALKLIAVNERMGVIDAHGAAMARAETLLKGGQKEAGLEALRLSLGLKPVPIGRYGEAVGLLESSGYAEEAAAWRAEMLELKLERGVESVDDIFALADVYLGEGRVESALDLMETITRKAPEDFRRLARAADLSAEYGHYKKVLEWRQKIAPLAPGDYRNGFEIAWLKAKLGRTEQALADILALLKDRNTPNEVRVAMAERGPSVLADEPTILKEAIAKVSEIVAKNPRDSHYLLLANLYMESGDEAHYIKTLDDAITTLAKPYRCVLALARHYAGHEQWNKAAAYFYKAIGRGDGNPAVYVELASALLKSGGSNTSQKYRMALDALPLRNYSHAYAPVYDPYNYRSVEDGVRAAWKDDRRRAVFWMELSRAAEELEWAELALEFAKAAFAELDKDEPARQSAVERPGHFRIKFFGPKQPSPEELRRDITRRIESLKDAFAEREREERDRLRITSNLENRR